MSQYDKCIINVKDTLDKIPANTPVYMLNLLKFHPVAQYTDPSFPSPSSNPKLSGREAYFHHYSPAFRSIAGRKGISNSVHFLGKPVANVVAEEGDPEWDQLLLVRYDNVDMFKKVAASQEYMKEAKPHHRAAVMRWKIVASVEESVPARL